MGLDPSPPPPRPSLRHFKLDRRCSCIYTYIYTNTYLYLQCPTSTPDCNTPVCVCASRSVCVCASRSVCVCASRSVCFCMMMPREHWWNFSKSKRTTEFTHVYTLQHTATHCNTLQPHTATHYHTLQHTTTASATAFLKSQRTMKCTITKHCRAHVSDFSVCSPLQPFLYSKMSCEFSFRTVKCVDLYVNVSKELTVDSCLQECRKSHRVRVDIW